MSCEPKRRLSTFVFVISIFHSFGAIHGNHRTREETKLESHFDPEEREALYLEINGLATDRETPELFQGHKVNQPSDQTQKTQRHNPRETAISGPGPQLSAPQPRMLNSLESEPGHRNHTQTPLRESNENLVAKSIKDGFQSDSSGLEDTRKKVVPGKIYGSFPSDAQEWFGLRPSVLCSPATISLTAKGRGHKHFLVAREGNAPISVHQVPSDCGFSVRFTWRDLILEAPFDGCYVLQENGSYVLPLLWWGKPLNISCPTTPVSTPAASPSGFCSNFGMNIKMKEPRGDMGQYKVKVNGEWVPLVSDMCAHSFVDSANEDKLLFIPFTGPCFEDGVRTLRVQMDGKEFALSCHPPGEPLSLPPHQPNIQSSHPHYPSQTQIRVTQLIATPTSPPPAEANLSLEFDSAVPPTQPPDVHFNAMNFPKGVLGGSLRYYQYPYMPNVYGIDSHSQPVVPTYATATTTARTAQTQTPRSTLPHHQPHAGMTMMHQFPHFPYQVPPYLYPYFFPFYFPGPASQTPQPTTKSAPAPKLPTKPPIIPIRQESQLPQLPIPPPPSPSKTSPSLTCTEDRLEASLPSAKTDSIKVKDVTKKVWVPLTSAPARCGYSLEAKDQGVVLISPLPACHSHALSSTLLSLSVKFWDVSQLRHRVLQLQCPRPRTPTQTQAPIPVTASSTPPPIWPWPWPWPPPPAGPVPKPPLLDPQSQQHAVPLFHPAKPPSSSSSSSHPPGLVLPTPRPSPSHQPQVLCHSQAMSVTLPPGAVTDLSVQTPSSGTPEKTKAALLEEAPSHCGYVVKKDHNGSIHILLPYASCHMTRQDGRHTILLKYRPAGGRAVEALLSCQVPSTNACGLPVEQRLACGPPSASASECGDLGCCYSSDARVCYYPMDQCTVDRHFVFSVPATLTDPPLTPSRLVTAGNDSCTPLKVVDDAALFKIPLDGCGAHRYEVGRTVVYMLEILNTLQSLSLNYGTITRDSPFRLIVECRYLPGAVVSVGYLVKSPSLGPSIQAQGVFGVQLRIAKDQQYSSYYPQYHQPLQKLLGKPLYLEVRLLNPPDPSAVLLVHYCVAYPRSAQSAWVLIYDGCPNPLDVTPTHKPPPPPPEEVAGHVRRFTVSTFQFLQSSKHRLVAREEEEEEVEEVEEEIYFMCATEVCLPSHGPCVEGCFDRASSDVRS